MASANNEIEVIKHGLNKPQSGYINGKFKHLWGGGLGYRG
jgi:hypothetical protein